MEKQRPMTRRDVLIAAAAGTGLLAFSKFGSTEQSPSQVQGPPRAKPNTGPPSGTHKRKLRISVFNDHLDWMWTYGNWGNPGMRYCFQRYQQAKIQRVYLRTHDGSLAQFPSQRTTPYRGIIDVQGKDVLGRDRSWYTWRGQGFDVTTFDPLRSAAELAPQFGVELWFYATPLLDCDTGNGWKGDFARAHPEWYRVFRDGTVSDTNMSWAYPEVMDYKLGTIRELLKYDARGILLDLVRQHCFKKGSQLLDDKGVCRAMYEKPIVEEFKTKTGRDPLKIPNDDEAWMRFRAGFNTEYVRRVRALIRSIKPKVQLGVMVRGIGHGGPQHKGDPYRECLLDVTAWAREGLIDLYMGDQWVSRQRTPRQLAEQVRLSISQVAGTKVPVALEMAIFDGGLDKIARGLPAVHDAGAVELALYQDTVLEDLTFEGEGNAWRQLGKMVAPYQ
jgi:hypothetical protein